MRIALVQYSSVKGDVQANIERHLQYVESAIRAGCQLVVFPELSLTGYEPSLAEQLAMQMTDTRLDVFREICDKNDIAIAFGIPLRQPNGISISMPLYLPQQPTLVYSKFYLHDDELPFFVPASNATPIMIKGLRIGFAICYELSVKEHRTNAIKDGVNVYIASAAKTEKGVAESYKHLSSMAESNKIVTMLVNSAGPSDDFIAAGQSACWDTEGNTTQAFHREKGMLIAEAGRQLTITSQRL